MQNENIANCFSVASGVAVNCLDGIDQEASLEQPQPAGNCINWVAGHILASHDRLLGILGEEPYLTREEAESYQQGAPPLKPGMKCEDIGRIRSGLEDTGRRIVSKLSSFRNGELDETIDPSLFPVPVESPTRGALANLFLYHDGYHTGQLQLLKRVLQK